MTDWAGIRKEYVTSHVSCRALAAKHGLLPSAVSTRATREHWVRLRRDHREREARSTQLLASTMQAVADKLLQRIDIAIEAQEQMDTKDLRALVSAVKDLIAIREACPELERQARIAELEEKLGNREGGIEVIFRAGEENWNE